MMSANETVGTLRRVTRDWILFFEPNGPQPMHVKIGELFLVVDACVVESFSLHGELWCWSVLVVLTSNGISKAYVSELSNFSVPL